MTNKKRNAPAPEAPPVLESTELPPDAGVQEDQGDPATGAETTVLPADQGVQGAFTIGDASGDIPAADQGDQGIAPAPETELRTDGPTLEEFVAAGYKAENYPPQGYAEVVKAPPVDDEAQPSRTSKRSAS